MPLSVLRSATPLNCPYVINSSDQATKYAFCSFVHLLPASIAVHDAKCFAWGLAMDVLSSGDAHVQGLDTLPVFLPQAGKKQKGAGNWLCALAPQESMNLEMIYSSVKEDYSAVMQSHIFTLFPNSHFSSWTIPWKTVTWKRAVSMHNILSFSLIFCLYFYNQCQCCLQVSIALFFI